MSTSILKVSHLFCFLVASGLEKVFFLKEEGRAGLMLIMEKHSSTFKNSLILQVAWQ